MSLKIIVKHKVCCFIRMSMNNLKDIHNASNEPTRKIVLFYQDVNEQFEGYTQLVKVRAALTPGCFIRMSMNNLKDIHNELLAKGQTDKLFYQDVNEQFEGYTQRAIVLAPAVTCCFIRMSMNNLKDILNEP